MGLRYRKWLRSETERRAEEEDKGERQKRVRIHKGGKRKRKYGRGGRNVQTWKTEYGKGDRSRIGNKKGKLKGAEERVEECKRTGI